MPPLTITRRQALGWLGATAAGSGLAQADRPVRIILPVSAGSGVDAITRAASAQLGKALGQTVVVENQPGAGGVVGTTSLVKSAPDGQTLGMVSNNHVIYPSVLKSVPFDPVADITPISVVCATPMLLVVNPSVPAKNLREFADLLKSRPGKLNFASSGNGTILHLGAELFKDVTETFSTHIPYRGTGPMLQDLVGGQVDWGVVALPAALGQVRAGQLRALCIASPQRSAAAPEIPTAAEQGFARYIVEGWVAAVGPKGLAPDLVRRLHQAFITAYSAPEVREAMAKQGNTMILGTPEAAAPHFRAELARYAALVKKAGVVPQ
ncbi:Bug family tripartite tricarboxylate transporter substrate binding protein [Ramlibacter sp. MAHUQ-53]|uniref:Bug family tripartite tricarboxylate transporter substrate binding protein n=1 Tax=unclassified Ramlibacter TaxID=2617605 RepID=UPI00363DEADC